MVKDFEIAETVVVKIPAIDREKCDLNRIPVMVISKRGKLQPKYALACRYGRIQGLFTASSLVFPGNIDCDQTKDVTLREAARLHSE